MKRIILFSIIMCSALLLYPALAMPLEESVPTIIRVSIMDDKDAVYVSVKDDYKIYAINSDRVVMEGPHLTAKVSATKEGIEIGRKEIKTLGVKIKSAKDSKIYVGGRRFRGDIDIVRKDNGKLMVINYVELDEYLYGVLYHEVSHRWPMEALKAQAIVARTFALYQARQNRLQPYDLRSDIYSQVYGGSTSEKWSTNMAVNVTKAKVLTYKGDLLPAYYHATCAGHTEDSSNLWKADMPPLDGVACDFCSKSPHYKWVKDIPLWTLENKLRDNGYKIGKIVSVTVLAKNASGRVDRLEIKDSEGVSVIFTGKDFRQLIGPNELRSTMFDASIRWGQLILEGRGWGHGVGMCQWGAFGQSRTGKKAEEILKYYYPGTEITMMDRIKGKP